MDSPMRTQPPPHHPKYGASRGRCNVTSEAPPKIQDNNCPPPASSSATATSVAARRTAPRSSRWRRMMLSHILYCEKDLHCIRDKILYYIIIIYLLHLIYTKPTKITDEAKSPSATNAPLLPHRSIGRSRFSGPHQRGINSHPPSNR